MLYHTEDWQWSPSGNSPVSCGSSISEGSQGGHASSSTAPPDLVLCPVPVGPDVNLHPVKKRRKRNRPSYSPFPRIWKNDIRRMLPIMYINAVNGGADLYQQFLHDFCVGSCSIIDNLDDTSICQALRSVKPLAIQGLDNVMGIMGMRVSSFPDLVASMERSWIRHQLNTPGSAVIAKINLRGTLPKDCLVEIATVKDKAVYRLPAFIVEELKVSGQLQAFEMSADALTHGMTELALQYNVRIDVCMVFLLDNDNRIYRVELHGQFSVQSASN